MKVIEYRIQYTGARGKPRATMTSGPQDSPTVEFVRVQATNINAGYAKALKVALEPLGNGQAREIGSIEFSQVR
jgi:hypothetical protein